MTDVPEELPHTAEVPLVRFRGVEKSFDGRTRVVRSLDLDVAQGEFLTLLGPSGSGKTTTLMMLAGFERPTAGEILVAGDRIDTLPPEKRGIGMVFQNYALFPHLTVAGNVGFPLRVRGTGKAEMERRVAAALAMVRLEAFADRRPNQLSGGQQQRVALARALVFEPTIVLLDEPLGALDRQLREQMQYEIKQLHDALGVTMIYVTHDQVEALTMSDRIAVFNEGRLCQVAGPRALYDRPDTLFVASFLGESNVLAGTLTGRAEAGGHAVVDIDGGARVLAAAPEGVAAGTRVSLVLRPERVLVGAEAANCANRFEARALEVTFVGDQLRSRLALFGEEGFVVKTQNAAGRPVPVAGEAVTVGWHAADCRAVLE